MRVVVTRPRPDGERTASVLRVRGHNVLLAPLMRVENIAADLTGDWGGVILTSANAARALNGSQTAELRNLAAFVVGRRTAEVAREAGFSEVTSADGDGGNLAELVAARCKDAPAPLLYLTGEDRAFDLEGELRGLGIAVKTAVVYRVVTQAYPVVLIDALGAGTVEAVLHFSRRSANRYLAGARAAEMAVRALAPRQLCLSAHVAAPLAEAGAAMVQIAVRPDESALLDLVESV